MHAFLPDSDYTVSVTSEADAIMHLKKKLLKDIDGFHALYIENGDPALLEHLTLLPQMIFTQGVVLSTVWAKDLSSISKKKMKNLQSAYIFQTHYSSN